MSESLIHDRGRGPELVGTRITVYSLLPHFMNATATEAQLCQQYELSAEQVAAARAYILTHHEEVIAEQHRIEARLGGENPPVVLEQTKQVREKLRTFKEWLSEKAASGNQDRFPTFQEWQSARERNGQTVEE